MTYKSIKLRPYYFCLTRKQLNFMVFIPPNMGGLLLKYTNTEISLAITNTHNHDVTK